MKTEDFDDAIKRKLESINPVFNEKDIERVHQYTIRNRGPLSVLRSSRFLWSVMGAGMLITGLVTWKLTSMYEKHNQVVQQVAVQKTIPEITKTEAPKGTAKADTVYLTKYVNKYPMSYSAKKGQKSKVLAAIHSNPGADARPGDTYKIAGTHLAPPSDIVLKDNNQNNNNSKGLIATTSANTKTETQNISSNNSASGSVKQNETASASNETAIKKAEVPEEKKEATTASIKKAPIHNYSEEHKKTNVSKPVLNLNVMAGIGGEMATTQYGGGIYLKLIANNRLSINAGIKELNINHQYFGEDETYQQNTGYDFKWKYAPDLSPNCDVTQIRFDYAIWQIPISLEYDFQLKNNWAITFSAGTDLDVSCTQSLEYVATENYGPYDAQPQAHNQVNNYKPVFFNNIVGSVGVLYQWHHLGVQLSPFASRQVAAAWYKGNSNMFYGGNLKLYYCF